MKLRRAAFCLLAVLMLLITVLLWAAMVKIEQVYRDLHCTQLAHMQTTCDPPADSGVRRIWVIAIGVVGGVTSLSFAWLAWQETLLLRRTAQQKIQQRIFEDTDFILSTGSLPPSDEELL